MLNVFFCSLGNNNYVFPVTCALLIIITLSCNLYNYIVALQMCSITCLAWTNTHRTRYPSRSYVLFGVHGRCLQNSRKMMAYSSEIDRPVDFFQEKFHLFINLSTINSLNFSPDGVRSTLRKDDSSSFSHRSRATNKLRNRALQWIRLILLFSLC